MDTQTISITKARNEFFDLMTQSYNNESVFEVEKNGILMGAFIPPEIYRAKVQNKKNEKSEQEEKLKLLAKIRKNREAMKMGSDSVEILRKLRNGQYYD